MEITTHKSQENTRPEQENPDISNPNSEKKESCANVHQFCNGATSPVDCSPLVTEAIHRTPCLLSDGRRKKLVLHMDLRNTILVADSVTQATVEQALNGFLTAVTWGYEDQQDGWEWCTDQPSLTAPGPGCRTYYKFLEQQLVRTPSDRLALRKATGNFTSTPIGEIFKPHFERHLHRLKWNYGTDRSPLTMAGSDGTLYHYILQGVYRLLQHLLQAGRDFALIIRTYGLDAPNALASLDYGIKGHHPGFPRSMPVAIARTTGIIQRPNHDVISLAAYTSAERLVELRQEKDIYRFLCCSQGVSGYKDDFLFWQNNGYNHHAGKPMWFDPRDEQHHHIMFDDNFRALDEDSVVDVRVLRPDGERSRSLSMEQIARLQDVCLVQADLLHSIDDSDYFLRKVELCEANYSHMLKTNAFPL